MTETERLTQLKQMLASNLIRERRGGIRMAAEMLMRDLCRDEVRSLLEGIAKNDLITTVQTDARQTLADDDASHSVQHQSPDYVFGARCPKGHVSYYDKREYCPRNSNITRRTIFRDARNVDEILLRCKTSGCGEEFYVEVDCEGYK